MRQSVSCVAMVSGGPPLLHCSCVRVCGGGACGGDGVRLVTLKLGDMVNLNARPSPVSVLLILFHCSLLRA